MGVYGSPEMNNYNSEKTLETIEKGMMYCYKCGTKYSKNFKKCPNCGAKKQKVFYNKWWFWIIVLFFAIIVTSNSDTSQDTTKIDSEKEQVQVEPQETEEEYKAKCISIPYNDVARNPNNYVAQYAVFKGKVVQVQESGKYLTLRVDVTKGQYGMWEDTVYVDYQRRDSNESRILEDDIITMYGKILGIKTYKTVLGNTISIPHLEAKYIEIEQ